MRWRYRQAEASKDRETYAYYLRDLGYLLRERGEATKKAVASAKGTGEAFEQGRRMAYTEVLSLMQNQADAFDIPLTELCLDGLDPYNDFW